MKNGYIVVADRYASANQIHQGGKISNVKKRQNFLKWLAEMEYKVFKIPKPYIVFYLNVPIPTVLKLIRERNKNNRKNFFHTKVEKNIDVHEKDVKFLENSRKSALWLAKTQRGWIKIECMKSGKLQKPLVIHNAIYEKLKEILR